jgi:hypothetical protein
VVFLSGSEPYQEEERYDPIDRINLATSVPGLSACGYCENDVFINNDWYKI